MSNTTILIPGKTVQAPGRDAAVIRIGDGPKGLALTTDVTQRYCQATHSREANRPSRKPGAT